MRSLNNSLNQRQQLLNRWRHEPEERGRIQPYPESQQQERRQKDDLARAEIGQFFVFRMAYRSQKYLLEHMQQVHRCQDNTKRGYHGKPWRSQDS